jgi:transcriptional regulator with XRE-family HTH domain
MPERSFGRTVRYRRTKLGLSQSKLAELVGRSTPTIRSWERDQSRPSDPKVVAALAAVLDIDENQLFDKVDVERPEVETSPTVEEALATLSASGAVATAPEPEPESEPDQVVDLTAEEEEATSDSEPTDPEDDPWASDPYPMPAEGPEYPRPQPVPALVGANASAESNSGQGESDDGLVARLTVAAAAAPAYAAPPEPYVQGPLTPNVGGVSYVEDESQRQLYRVRNLATFVAVIALVIVFIWALGEGVGALGEWWDDFFGNLRL